MQAEQPRDHGGNLDAARARFGGAALDWLDLSTGINPHAYPLPDLPSALWARLPDAHLEAAFTTAARTAYGVPKGADVMACNGAQGVIQLMPRLLSGQRVSVISPTYNEHAASFAAQGWDVHEGPAPAPDADVIVAVTPNNPDGRVISVGEVARWRAMGKTVVLDQSFADPEPALSHATLCTDPGVIVLRSFGKFFGLAGLRLGALIATPALITRAKSLGGPWAVSGPALHIGAVALSDVEWQQEMRQILADESAALCDLLRDAGFAIRAATPLFVLLETLGAQALQDQLAKHHIWSRVFPYNPTWMRLGVPRAQDLLRLRAALG